MKPKEAPSQRKKDNILDEMERAKYWATLLHDAISKHDIYVFAKYNLDSNNKNSIKQEKAKKILEDAIKGYEEIYNR